MNEEEEKKGRQDGRKKEGKEGKTDGIKRKTKQRRPDILILFGALKMILTACLQFIDLSDINNLVVR